MIFATGNFLPSSASVLRGSFNLILDADGLVMETSTDFFFAGASAPGFALARGVPVDLDDPVLTGDVTDTRFLDLPGQGVPVCGQHVGLIPPSGDIGAYTTLILWCFRTGQALGYGPIKKADPARVARQTGPSAPILEMTGHALIQS